MPVHSLLVESVYLRPLGGSAGGNDVLGDQFDRYQLATGEKKLGPLARKGPRDGAADRASGSVDHRNFVPKHDVWSPVLCLCGYTCRLIVDLAFHLVLRLPEALGYV